MKRWKTPGPQWLHTFRQRLHQLCNSPLSSYGVLKSSLGFERVWIGLVVQLSTQIYGESSIQGWEFNDPHPVTLDYTFRLADNSTRSLRSQIFDLMLDEIGMIARLHPKNLLARVDFILSRLKSFSCVEDLPCMLELRDECIELSQIFFEGESSKGVDLYEVLCHSILDNGITALKYSSELGRSFRNTFTTQSVFSTAMVRPSKGFGDFWMEARKYILHPFLHGYDEHLNDLASHLYFECPRPDVREWLEVQLDTTFDWNIPGELTLIP